MDTSATESVQAATNEPNDHPQSLVITREENRILKIPNFELAERHQQNLHHLLQGIHNDPDGFSGCVNRKRQRDFVASCAPTVTAGGRPVQSTGAEGDVGGSGPSHTSPIVGINSFHSFRQIGKGKFSVVFFARMAQGNTPCALKKVILPHTKNEAQAEQMKRHIRGEIKLLQSVNHPNIVRFLDSFTEHGNLYIVLEWGGICDMRQIISRLKERKQTMEKRTVWIFFSQICEAVKHMHEKRIMHRDIKPANMFVDIEHGLLKVGDLGLSRAMHEYSLKAFSQVGTPLYMSPEVLKGDGHDFASDLWSLGCVLYELAMLRSPFEGSNGDQPKPDLANGGQTALFQLFQNIIKCKYPNLEPQYGSDMNDLVHTMLQLNPRSRPNIIRVANFAMHARCSYADDRSNKGTNGNERLDGFISNPSTTQVNRWYLEQSQKSSSGSDTGAGALARSGNGADSGATDGTGALANDGFTSFVDNQEDQTAEVRGLLEASTNAGQCLKESLNGTTKAEGSFAVSDDDTSNYFEGTSSSRPCTAGATAVEKHQDPESAVVEDSCRLSRASSFDLNEDESHYDMGETSNMTIEDSQDDIVCIDPSVIRQLRIQHGLATSKEYENEDDVDDDEDLMHCNRDKAETSNLDDDNLSESERLVDDVEAMRLEVDVGNESDVNCTTEENQREPHDHLDAKHPLDLSHGSVDSINMTYSSCDSQPTPKSKGNQKEDSTHNAPLSQTFPPARDKNGEPLNSHTPTAPSKRVTLPIIGDIEQASGGEDPSQSSMPTGMSRSEPLSRSQSLHLLEEPIHKEFQSEELGTVSHDFTGHSKSKAGDNAAHLTSSSMCIFPTRYQHEQLARPLDMNCTSSHPLEDAGVSVHAPQPQRPLSTLRDSRPRITGSAVASNSTGAEGTQAQALHLPSVKRSECQDVHGDSPQLLPDVKHSHFHGSRGDSPQEFSDVAVNVNAPHLDDSLDTGGNYIPPPILVSDGDAQSQKLEARSHKQKREAGMNGLREKRKHSQLSESPPAMQSNISSGLPDGFGGREHPARASKYLMHRLKRLLLPGRAPTGVSLPRGHNNKYKIAAS